MDNNNLSIDYTHWERGKDYPEYFGLHDNATISYYKKESSY
jgi:Ni/Co efflux regulator RcnB